MLCNHFFSLRKNFFEVKHSSAEMDKEYKIIQGKIRKLQDEIMVKI